MTDLVVIAGPIAAGKTTVARTIAERLRADGAVVALVELDEVAEMTARADWSAIHRVFAEVVGSWLRIPVDVVIAEGPGSADEVSLVGHEAPDGVRVTVCVVDAPFETALARAVADPTRGVSRQPDFLAGEYERWGRERDRISADVRIDTASASIADAAVAIAAVLRE